MTDTARFQVVIDVGAARRREPCIHVERVDFATAVDQASRALTVDEVADIVADLNEARRAVINLADADEPF